jgi:hypothetical protein
MASMVKRLKAELNNLQAEIDRLQKQADGIRLTVEYLERKENIASPTGTIASPMPRVPKKYPVEGPSALVKAMIDILKANGAPMHYRELYKTLLHNQIPVGGKDPQRNVSAHLSLNKELFEPLGSGIWALRE